MHPSAIAKRFLKVGDEVEKQTKEGKWKDDIYTRGLVDGLILANAILKGEEPKYLVLTTHEETALVEPKMMSGMSVGELREFVQLINDKTFLEDSLKHEIENKNRRGAVDTLKQRLLELE